MKTLQKLNKEIEKEKRKLIRIKKDIGLYENFGQKEYRKLNEKYGFISSAEYNSEEERKESLALLKNFCEWCENETI